MSTGALIVVVFALSVLWFMWRQIKGNLVHLDEEDLDNFLSNRMGEKELKRTREHLLRCESCKLRLDEMTKKAQKIKPDRWLKRRF
jgi:hypothetical protein